MNSRKVINYVSQTAIFGGLAAILYCVPGLQFNVPFAPPFMSIHLDDIPILLSSFAFGPLVGVFSIILRTLIKLPMTSTLCVGELGDFMYSLALVLPASLIYQKHRTFKGALFGTLIGLILTLFFSTVVNLYTIFPFYKQLYNMKDGDIASMFDSIFKWGITSDYDIRLAVLLLPFNLLKNGIVVLATFFSYKPLRMLIERNKKI